MKGYPFLELLVKYAEKKSQGGGEDAALWSQIYVRALAELESIVGGRRGGDVGEVGGDDDVVRELYDEALSGVGGVGGG